MDLGLCGKVVVITGGTAGIGLATANAFLQEGASVAVCGRRRELLDDAVKTLGEAVFACQADMTDEADVSSFAHQVYAHFGHIDVWVNNVGASIARQGDWYTPSEIDAHYAVNFKYGVYPVELATPAKQ